ncbi:MAG: SPOR domain-containing protein [Ignavibacteria bacterium]|nr:SPOR domain-containing protein [Ignavibacteria bacterium]
MKHVTVLLLWLLISCTLVILGCSSSQESSEKQGNTEPPPVQSSPKTDVGVIPKVDTLNVNKETTPKPSYEPKSISQHGLPTGRFSVQIGAYKMPDNADRIASLAKDRFGKNVYTTIDKNDNLYKVMIGDFMTKEEARGFRDEMVQKFPSDYKDAWVSENSQK